VSVIAIDSSSRAAALVLRTTAEGRVLDSRELPGGELDRRLPGALAAVLAGDVEAVVVLTGPGSYSGVRAGMAAALGVAGARGLPLHGLGTLAAVAAAASMPDGGQFSAVADAGRGGVYVARFERRGPATVQVSAVRRSAADDVDGRRPLFATVPIAGLVAELIDPVRALAAAVPVAMGLPQLEAAGLSATHAAEGDGTTPPATGR
jgi:tRNA threonylcarbamoyl adenosine modification protein YeaZ